MQGDETFNQLIEYFSSELRNSLREIPDIYKNDIEEVRLRINSPLNISFSNNDYFIKDNGKLSHNPKDGLLVNRDQIDRTFQLITNYSNIFPWRWN